MSPRRPHSISRPTDSVCGTRKAGATIAAANVQVRLNFSIIMSCTPYSVHSRQSGRDKAGQVSGPAQPLLATVADAGSGELAVAKMTFS